MSDLDPQKFSCPRDILKRIPVSIDDYKKLAEMVASARDFGTFLSELEALNDAEIVHIGEMVFTRERVALDNLLDYIADAYEMIQKRSMIRRRVINGLSADAHISKSHPLFEQYKECERRELILRTLRKEIMREVGKRKIDKELFLSFVGA